MRIAALLSAFAMLVLVGLGVACGPEDNYCVAEGRSCDEEERRRNNMEPGSDADGSGEDDGGVIVFDGSN